MKNKKGFVLSIPILITVVLLVVIILIFSSINKFAVIGGGIMVLSFIYAIPAALQGEFTTGKIVFLMFLFVIGGLIIALPYTGILQMEAFTTDTAIERLAIPHKASFKCQQIGFADGVRRAIPSGGLYFSQNTLGFYSPAMTNIDFEISQSAWSSVAGLSSVRLVWKICDNVNCQTYNQAYDSWGTWKFPIESLDLTKYTMTVWTEKGSLWVFWKGWVKVGDIGYISYDAAKYGLTLYSTTSDPAGAVICETSCDLDCPPQSYREKLIYTPKNTLGFLETAPYLEYWEDISYDLNAQGGVSVYNKDTGKFCLAGDIYDSAVLELDNGEAYIYPNTLTHERKTCCPGANIAITNGIKVCNNNYEWETVLDEDLDEDGKSNVQCPLGSDIECPGSGLTTCSFVGGKYLESGWSCGSDKYCYKSDNKEVDCCAPDLGCAVDQTCQAGKCVGGTTDIPISKISGNKTSTRASCESRNKEGSHRWEWVEGTDYPWYKFWKEDKLAYCRDTWTIYFILGGIGVFMLVIIITLMLTGRRTSNGSGVAPGFAPKPVSRPRSSGGTVINVRQVHGNTPKRKKSKKSKKNKR